MNEDRIRAVWLTELESLELDVIRAERLVKGLNSVPREPWQPPAVPGQIPIDLAARAQELLDRQDRAAADLVRALTAAQRQVAYADKVIDHTGPQAGPVYLDLEA